MSLTPYVPRLAADMLAEGLVPALGRSADYQAAVLFVDISGFTALADLITARFGERGAERLQDLLNACFAPLVETVDGAGGQVLAFPGDAAICLWPLKGDDRSALKHATNKAAQCSLLLRRQLDGLSGAEGIQVRIRAAITAGPIRASLVGGVNGRWHLLVRGDAIHQLAGVIGAAAAGDIVLSAEARRAHPLLRQVIDGAPSIVDGSLPTTSSDDGALGGAALETDLRPLVPASVRMRLDAGQQSWMSEFRVVSVMFVRIATIPADGAALQETVERIQSSIERLDGELYQLLVDEQGLAAVAVFGLFHQSHEDDGARAVTAAREVCDGLPKASVDPRIGITTGRVFTGMRGGTSRMEPAVIGSTVVLAARLAAVAEDILCDAATRARASAVFRFDPAPAVLLKGKGVVSDLWRPRRATANLRTVEDHSAIEVVGREDERALVDTKLAELAEHSTGGVMFVTGEPGIGKSALVEAVRASAAKRGLTCALGAGDSIQSSTPLRAWRSVFTSLLELDDAGGDEVSIERLIELLGNEDADWFPLLSPVLPIQCPENDRTHSLTAESRASAAMSLMVTLLGAIAQRRRVLVILEDAHWIDSSSWELAAEVQARLPQLLLLLTMRVTSNTGARIAEMAASRHADTIQLEPMTASEIAAIVAARLGAAGLLSDDPTNWIQRRCEGNPLFALELASMLIERGAAAAGADQYRVIGDNSAGGMAALPDTVRGVLAARIDRLSAEDQLTLKVAAVLGRQFDFESLTATYPQHGAPDAIRARVKRVAATGLFSTPSDNTAAMSFSHALVQEVAYDLLPFAQRRVLHQRAAEHFEGRGLIAGPTLSPLLAYHWERAEVRSKAMVYLERAGVHALTKTASNPEAEDFLARLIRLAEAQTGGEMEGGAPDSVARAGWHRMLAQAVARQGRHTDALSHLERGLGLLGRSLPRAGFGSRVEGMCGITARLAGFTASRRPARTASADDRALREAARLFDGMVQLLYLGKAGKAEGSSDAALLSIVALLRSAKLSERVGASGELSCAYSMLANLLAMFRRPRLALLYAERAREMAEQIGDKQALFRALTIGQLPAFVYGRWHEAEPRLREGLVLGAALRNDHETLIAECTLAHVCLHRGQLEEARTRFASLHRRALDSAFLLPQLWAMAGSAEVNLRLERLSDAIATAEECLRLADDRKSVDQNSRFQAHGVMASALSRQGNHERALCAVQPAIGAAKAGAHLSFSAQAGFVGVAEALLAVCASSTAPARDCEAELRRWLWRLRAAAYCRPILEPCSLYFRAAWNQRRGRHGKAKRQFIKSIRLADELSMPNDASRGRRALAQLAGQRANINPAPDA